MQIKAYQAMITAGPSNATSNPAIIANSNMPQG